MTKTRFILLLEKYRQQQLSPEELKAFLDAAGDPVLEALLVEALGQTMEQHKPPGVADAQREQALWQRIDTATSTNTLQPVRSRRWMWAAAACLLAIAGLGVYQWQSQPATPAQPVAQATDIAPGRQGALLTLANGTQVVLDSAHEGVIATQAGAQVSLQQGSLAYQSTGDEKDAAAFNELHIPNGRQFQVTLPDGSHVWLNAASSLRYPVHFSGKERRVEISGEAYFEIAPKADAPFYVDVTGKTGIAVLGTAFNVHAYGNEALVKTTLVSGKIKVSSANRSILLQPGQQAQSGDTQPLQIVNTDIEQATAWKEGFFNFEGAHLQEVMQQLERWYDITVVYEKGVPDVEFSGEMTRGITLKGVLVALEKSDVHFHLEGRTLTVMP